MHCVWRRYGRRPCNEETNEAVRRLLEAGAPLVVVTLGDEGAIAASAKGQWWYQPTTPRDDTKIVDTTGAGDAFAAGFLFGWCGGQNVRRGLTYGCACGTAAVGLVGGSNPLDADLVNRMMRRNDGIEQLPEVWKDSYRDWSPTRERAEARPRSLEEWLDVELLCADATPPADRRRPSATRDAS